VDHCPGCDKPRRAHSTAHGDEIRHLHNNHVRCFGDRTAQKRTADVVGTGADVGPEDKELAEPPVDENNSMQTMASGPQFFDPYLASVPNGGNWEGLDQPMSFQDALDYSANSYGTHHTADYLGRPDANNPTGRGPDEFRAERWNAYTTTHPFQDPKDRRMNTPVLPSEHIPTRNRNTPTTGREEDERRNRDDDDDDD